MVVTYSVKFKPQGQDESTEVDAADVAAGICSRATLSSGGAIELDPLSGATELWGTASTPPTDLEDLSSELEHIDSQTSLPPLVRYKKKNKISVTDLSQQLWCERQLEFTLTTGRKRETAAMKAGTARHELLEKADHDIVEVVVETREDNLGLRLLNSVTLLEQLIQTGKSREIWVFCVNQDVLIRGVIDEAEIRVDPKSGLPEVWLSDTKTRRKMEEPSDAQKRTSAIQLQMYCHIVSEMRRGETDYDKLIEYYEVDGEAPFQCQELIMSGHSNLYMLIAAFRSTVQTLPPVHTEMEVVYEFEGTEFSRNRIPFNSVAMTYTVQELLDWWRGHRASDGVMPCESWKCRFCEFVGECPVTPLPPDKVVQAVSRLNEEALTTG